MKAEKAEKMVFKIFIPKLRRELKKCRSKEHLIFGKNSYKHGGKVRCRACRIKKMKEWRVRTGIQKPDFIKQDLLDNCL